MSVAPLKPASGCPVSLPGLTADDRQAAPPPSRNLNPSTSRGGAGGTEPEAGEAAVFVPILGTPVAQGDWLGFPEDFEVVPRCSVPLLTESL